MDARMSGDILVPLCWDQLTSWEWACPLGTQFQELGTLRDGVNLASLATHSSGLYKPGGVGWAQL